MQAHLQRVEVQPVRRRDDDFPVDDAAVGQVSEHGGVYVGEIAIQRPQLPALNVGAAAAAKDDGAEAVPFRLEEHTLALGKLRRELGEHRLDRRIDGVEAGRGVRPVGHRGDRAPAAACVQASRYLG